MIKFVRSYIVPIARERMRLVLAYLVPPLIPTILLIGMFGYTIISEKMGAPRIMDGRIDDAPTRVSSAMILINPFFYALFGIANFIDSLGDRLRNPLPWFFTAMIILSVGGALSLILYSPQVDSSPAPAVRSSFMFVFAVFSPMAFMRRFFRGRETVTIRNP